MHGGRPRNSPLRRSLGAFARGRWEGRPRTPPFKWGEQGEILPPHDTWLQELSLQKEGLASLVEQDLLRADPSMLEQDLERTKELLVQHAGALQVRCSRAAG